MVAVVIDPYVCKSSIWFLFPECWGIAVMAALPLAVSCAAVVRRLSVVRIER